MESVHNVSAEVYVIVAAVLTGAFTVAGTTWGLSWSLSRRFSEIKGELFQRIEKLQDNILGKLEYHERHDDRRFGGLRNDLWEIRLRNAAKDGITLKDRREEETFT